jgi:non-heme chloroperoxidase
LSDQFLSVIRLREEDVRGLGPEQNPANELHDVRKLAREAPTPTGIFSIVTELANIGNTWQAIFRACHLHATVTELLSITVGVIRATIMHGTAARHHSASQQKTSDRILSSVLVSVIREPRETTMPIITAQSDVDIFFKDWGPKDAQPIVFHHGWPLSSDDWDAQMLFFLQHGYRVIAHDRRGHGRSSQVSDGHDMDHYAADASAVVERLNLRNAVHIGHSTGGGEVARYVARFGEPQGRVAKAVLVSAIPPLMLKTEANPEGLPIEVFDGFRASLSANRAQFYLDVPSGPFYGFNRKGAKISPGAIQNFWRQGMIGGAKAQYDGIKAFSETDQTEDLRAIAVPTLVLHGEDDQIVPIADSSVKSVKLLKNGTLKTYPGFSHGMLTINADVLNADLLRFVEQKLT